MPTVSFTKPIVSPTKAVAFSQQGVVYGGVTVGYADPKRLKLMLDIVPIMTFTKTFVFPLKTIALG